MIKGVLVGLIACGMGLAQQQNANTIVEQPLPTVTQIGAQYTGIPGNQLFCYWVIAKFAVGNSQVSNPTCTVVSTVGGSVAVTWNAPNVGTNLDYVLSYDVLRTTTNSIQRPCSNCLLASGTTATRVTDNLGVLSSGYVFSDYQPGVSQQTIDNTSTDKPILYDSLDGQKNQSSVRNGNTLPIYCNPGDVFVLLGGNVGAYDCLVTNVWTLIGSGGSPSAIGYILFNGTGATFYAGCSAAVSANMTLAFDTAILNIPAGTCNADTMYFSGSSLQPVANATVNMLGSFTSISLSKHIDVSNSGAVLAIKKAGVFPVEIWGALGNGTTDDTNSFNNAYLSLIGVPHTVLTLRPNANYRVSCVLVQPYVHLQGNQATLTQIGNCTNGLLYIPSGINPEVIVEDLFLEGDPTVASNNIDFTGVQLPGLIKNVYSENSGAKGIRINQANIYVVEDSSSISNAVNGFSIENSNDVTFLNVTAQTIGAIGTPSTGSPIVLSGTLNFNGNKIHCEIANGTECLRIDNNSLITNLRAITTYYVQGQTSPGVVTIRNSSRNVTIDGINAIVQAGTVVLSFLIQDFVSGQNVAGATATGFSGLANWGYYTSANTLFNSVNAPFASTSTLGTLNINGVLNPYVAIIGSTFYGNPTVGGCGATISNTSTMQSGIVTSGTTGTCSFSITWTGGAQYPHGALCFAWDITNVAEFHPTIITTAATTLSGTTTSGDQIWYQCAVGH